MEAFCHVTPQLFNQSASSHSRHNKNHMLKSISCVNFQSRYGRSVHLLLYYYRVLQHDSVTFHDLIQATDVVIQRPKEIIPSDHQQLLSEVETIYR